MSDDQTDDPSSKPEPLHVVVDERRGGADLNSVSVIGRVLKETVVRIENLTREKKEEFSARTTVVKTIMEIGGGGKRENKKLALQTLKHLQMNIAA